MGGRDGARGSGAQEQAPDDQSVVAAAVKLQQNWRGVKQRAELPPGFGTWDVESAPHDQARSENNPLYRGKRTPVEDERVPWDVPFDGYAPTEFTAKDVLANANNLTTGAKWADPPNVQELRAELEKRLTYENNGKLFFGGDGRPLNPRGRTGMKGRGLLGQWGPNHAADPIVTRKEPLTGSLQVRGGHVKPEGGLLECASFHAAATS